MASIWLHLFCRHQRLLCKAQSREIRLNSTACEVLVICFYPWSEVHEGVFRWAFLSFICDEEWCKENKVRSLGYRVWEGVPYESDSEKTSFSLFYLLILFGFTSFYSLFPYSPTTTSVPLNLNRSCVLLVAQSIQWLLFKHSDCLSLFYLKSSWIVFLLQKKYSEMCWSPSSMFQNREQF